MYFLPWAVQWFETSLESSEVMRRLTAAVLPTRDWQSVFESIPLNYFRGQVAADSFNVSFRAGNKNTIQVKGSIRPIANGSRLRVHYHYPILFLGILGWWLGGFSLFIILGALQLIPVRDADSWAILFPIAAVVFVGASTVFSFNKAVRRAQQELVNLLELRAIARD